MNSDSESSLRSAVAHSLAWAVGVGLVYGLTNSWVNAVGRTFTDYPNPPQGLFIKLIGSVLGTAWCWCFAAFLIGRRSRRADLGAASGVAALVTAVIAYYLSDAAIGTDTAFSGGEAMIWAVAGVFAGSVMGALGGAAAPVNPGWFLMALIAVALLMLIAVGMIRVSVVALGSWPLLLALAITVLFTAWQFRVRHVQLRGVSL